MYKVVLMCKVVLSDLRCKVVLSRRLRELLVPSCFERVYFYNRARYRHAKTPTTRIPFLPLPYATTARGIDMPQTLVSMEIPFL